MAEALGVTLRPLAICSRAEPACALLRFDKPPLPRVAARCVYRRHAPSELDGWAGGIGALLGHRQLMRAGGEHGDGRYFATWYEMAEPRHDDRISASSGVRRDGHRSPRQD